jgi:hypothetical protein
MTEAIAAAGAAFLIAVLWFDLMFDVQVLRYRGEKVLPENVLESIAGYYRRVTTTASPMGRLVAVVMAVLVVTLVVQAASGHAPTWASLVALPAAAVAIGLAMFRVFGRARRLGGREGTPGEQSVIARSIFRDHVICLALMTSVLVVQIAAAASS